jgi:hypothetical protein
LGVIRRKEKDSVNDNVKIYQENHLRVEEKSKLFGKNRNLNPKLSNNFHNLVLPKVYAALP